MDLFAMVDSAGRPTAFDRTPSIGYAKVRSTYDFIGGC
jgi:hypothetical protein